MNLDLYAIAWVIAWFSIDVLCIATAVQIRKFDRSRMSLAVFIGAIMLALSRLTNYVASGLILKFTESPADAFLPPDSAFFLMKIGGILGLLGMALFVSGLFVIARRHAKRALEFNA